MSFCCGASMVGAIGTLRQNKTYVHNVPLLVCPVCHQIEVHNQIVEEYEILLDYAESDGAKEVDFEEYIDPLRLKDIFENCISILNNDQGKVFNEQIDEALDLMLVAKQLKDKDWETELKKRLKVISRRKKQILAS